VRARLDRGRAQAPVSSDFPRRTHPPAQGGPGRALAGNRGVYRAIAGRPWNFRRAFEF
jgi:hypothetical protein